jgi:hypothetical protein
MMALAAAMLSASTAHASRIGDLVHALYLYPDTSTVYNDLGTVVIGASDPTFPDINGAGTFDINLTAGQIVFNFTGTGASFPADFDGVAFVDLTTPFSSASLEPSSDVAGVSAADLSLIGGEVFLNLNDASFNAGDQITIDVPEGGGPGVPEPASWALMLAGIGLTGAMARRRGRSLTTAGA